MEGADQDLLTAALREVREEVGLSLQKTHRWEPNEKAAASPIFDLDVHQIPPRKEMPAHLHYDVRFLLAVNDKNVKAGSDAKDARWFSLDSIEGIESDESVLRAVRKIEACLSGAGGGQTRGAGAKRFASPCEA